MFICKTAESLNALRLKLLQDKYNKDVNSNCKFLAPIAKTQELNSGPIKIKAEFSGLTIGTAYHQRKLLGILEL